MHPNRRPFLKDVGRGMIIASVGPALAADLFPGRLRADDAPDRLTFGKLDSLVALMQETGARQTPAAAGRTPDATAPT